VICGAVHHPGITCQLPAGHRERRHVHEHTPDEMYRRTVVHTWPVKLEDD
jgi:hypothetical protein